MPKVNMRSSCTVQLADGRVVTVHVGESEVPDEVAEHWYLQHHMHAEPEPDEPESEPEADEPDVQTKRARKAKAAE